MTGRPEGVPSSREQKVAKSNAIKRNMDAGVYMKKRWQDQTVEARARTARMYEEFRETELKSFEAELKKSLAHISK